MTDPTNPGRSFADILSYWERMTEEERQRWRDWERRGRLAFSHPDVPLGEGGRPLWITGGVQLELGGYTTHELDRGWPNPDDDTDDGEG